MKHEINVINVMFLVVYANNNNFLWFLWYIHIDWSPLHCWKN